MDEDQRFFESRSPEDSGIGQRPPGWSTTKKAVAAGALVLALAGMWFWHSRSATDGRIWVMNGGATPVAITVLGDTKQAEPGKLLELQVPVRDQIELEFESSAGHQKLPVDAHDQSKDVALVDLTEDGAYAVVDVSYLFNDAQPPAALTIAHLSPPNRVHRLPFAASRLIGPGRPLPDKGSWELHAFDGAKLEIYKVFRVDQRRLADQKKLGASLLEGLRSGSVVSFENLRIESKTSSASRNSRIPKAGS
jgi:hypothetical protein